MHQACEKSLMYAYIILLEAIFANLWMGVLQWGDILLVHKMIHIICLYILYTK